MIGAQSQEAAMSQSSATLDPAKTRAVVDQLSRSGTGRALLDGLTDARLGRLGDTMGTIVAAINQARDEVRDLKSEWKSSGANRQDMSALATNLNEADEAILRATRHLRIMTSGLRAGGIDECICTLIDQQVTHVLIACEGNEVSADQLSRMAGMLGALEGSVSRLTGARPPAPANDDHRHRA